MNRNTSITSAVAVAAGILLAAAGNPVHAVPVNAQYLETPVCDAIPPQFLTHELGDAAVFPPNEGFVYTTTPAAFTVCVPDDGLANDWIVRMTNTSGIAWNNLFFAIDANGGFGNVDGLMRDVALAPNVNTEAMRIDGTVTPGINNNLLNESILADEIFAPGEQWTFNVSNFFVLNTAGVFQPPIFLTPGVFSGSSPIGPGNPGNASILANPVPEPTTIGAIGLVATALLMRRPRRA